MGANRILHAIQPSGPKTKNWRMVYKPVMPINSLVSYPFIRRSTLKESLKNLERLRKVTEGKVLAIDCGIYTLKVKLFGMTAQMGSQAIVSRSNKIQGLQYLDEFRSYVKEYAKFLRDGYELYDYAFDFDSDAILPTREAEDLSWVLFDILGQDKLSKIARVYHVVRDNVNQWWEQYCQDSKFDFAAIEGGAMHRKNPQFYHYLIEKAHRGRKKVHILAVSGEGPPLQIPADYMDTSAHRLGGHKAQLQTPYGSFQAGQKVGKGHILNQPRHVQNFVEEWLGGYGLTIQQMIDQPDGQYYRIRMNIIFINEYWDKPYVSFASTGSLF